MNFLFKITGTVIKNAGRGKKLGFPTANIEAPRDARDGIYLGYTHMDGKSHPALLFIGAAVTFDESVRFAESYLLDFQGDLYGKTIVLEFVEYIRESRKFVSPEEMRKQIEEDERIARAYFGI